MKNKFFFILCIVSLIGFASLYVAKQSSYIKESMAAFQYKQDKDVQEEEAKERFFQETKEADKRAAQEYLRQQ